MTMMSLEMFHEQILKGKNPQEVYELIEDFKIEMIFLKVQIEQKNILKLTLPPEDMVSKIKNYRFYIEDSYRYIESLNGEVNWAEEDAFTQNFQKSIPFIEKIDYSENDKNLCEILFDEDSVRITQNKETVPSIDKEFFLNALSELHMGEWREVYTANDYGLDSINGFSWKIKVYFKYDMDTVLFTGTDAYPYNYKTFKQLIQG